MKCSGDGVEVVYYRRPPHGGRGLKCFKIRRIYKAPAVAPRTGGVD